MGTNSNNDFDLKTFQSEVFQDMRRLIPVLGAASLHSKGYKSVENYQNYVDTSFSVTGLLTRGIFAIISAIGWLLSKKVLEKPDFLDKQSKAITILDDLEIRNIVCPTLRREITPDLFREGAQVKIVKIITGALTREEIVREYSIDRDVRLFSLMAIIVWQKGIAKYCN